MTQPLDPRVFADIEGTEDAGRIVQYLRDASALPAVQAMNDNLDYVLGVRARQQIIDVGCGVGDDVRRLAGLVGSKGRVVGLDVQKVVDAARELGVAPNVDFVAGDAHAIPFEDASFDGYRAHRVYMHLDDSAAALSEAVRVVRPGGAIVVSEPDWGTMAIDSDDRELTRAIVDAIGDAMREPWIGRRLPRLFREAGLVDVQTALQFGVFSGYAEAHKFLLADAITHVLESGRFGSDRVAGWQTDLQRRDADGGVFIGGLTVVARGFRPSEGRARSLGRKLSRRISNA